MNVELPDGTVIEDVPDDMTKVQLAEKLKANGHSVPDDWLPKQEEGTFHRLARTVPGVGLAARSLEAAGGLGAKIAGGLVGGAALPFVGAEGSTDIIRDVRDRLTPTPMDGAENDIALRALGKVGEVAGKITAPLDRKIEQAGPGISTFVPAVAEAATDIAGILPAGRIPKAMPKSAALKEVLARNEVPSREALKAASQESYGVAHKAGVVIPETSVRGIVDDFAPKVNPKLQPRADGVVEQIGKMLDGDVSLSKLEEMRRMVSAAQRKNPVDDDMRVLGEIKTRIDGALNAVAPDNPVGVQAIKDARNLYMRQAKDEDFADMMERADLTAKSKPTVTKHAAVKNEFFKLAKDPEAMKLYTPAEQEAIKRIATGTGVTNTLQQIGRLATGLSSHSLGTAALVLGGGGHLGAAAGVSTLFGVGAGANKLASVFQNGSIRELSELVRKGPAGSAPLKRAPPTAGRPQTRNLLEAPPIYGEAPPPAPVGVTPQRLLPAPGQATPSGFREAPVGDYQASLHPGAPREVEPLRAEPMSAERAPAGLMPSVDAGDLYVQGGKTRVEGRNGPGGAKVRRAADVEGTSGGERPTGPAKGGLHDYLLERIAAEKARRKALSPEQKNLLDALERQSGGKPMKKWEVDRAMRRIFS